jgi:rhodanese-related sulfurtransferase
MKNRNICLLLLLIVLNVSCTFSFKRDVYGEGKVSSVGACDFADSISRPGVQLVDVRTPEEFSEGNIPGSLNIDVMTGHFAEEASAVLDKEALVAVYCRSGNRSKNAAKMLSMMGYDVVELDGGYREWLEFSGSR